MKTQLIQLEMLLKEQGLISTERNSSGLIDLIGFLDEDAKDNPRYICFDMECIYSRSDYANILAGFREACSDRNAFEIVSMDLDPQTKMADMQLIVNGLDIRCAWNQNEDWVSEEFFATLDNVNEALRGRFVSVTIDQYYRAIYIENIDIANSVSELYCELRDNLM